VAFDHDTNVVIAKPITTERVLPPENIPIVCHHEADHPVH
jgi:hypothetical protein